MEYLNKYMILLCLAMTVGLSSCERGCDPPINKERVLLVYVGVDNNLNGFELDKLNGIRDGWSGRSTDKIIAYVDKRNDGAVLYDIAVNGNSDFVVLERYGRENSASAEVFSRVIEEMKATYPQADSYGLLVFSHASGWLPGDALSNPYRATYVRNGTRSMVNDGNNNMELADFAAAIPDNLFDYIAFEMCFMAGVEVAYELRNKTPYILASSAEIIHPGFAPVYPTSTHHLMNGSMQGFGQSVFDHILTYDPTNPQRSATFSVIRTAGLDALMAFVRDNCDPSMAVNIGEVQHFDRNNYRLFFDFEDYFGRLLGTQQQRDELSNLVETCVPWRVNTTDFLTQSPGNNGFTIHRHSGLTTYIAQPQFPGLNIEYGKLTWSRAIIF